MPKPGAFGFSKRALSWDGLEGRTGIRGSLLLVLLLALPAATILHPP